LKESSGTGVGKRSQGKTSGESRDIVPLKGGVDGLFGVDAPETWFTTVQKYPYLLKNC
jgi:hypothetical protein